MLCGKNLILFSASWHLLHSPLLCTAFSLYNAVFMPHIIESNDVFTPDYWDGVSLDTYQGPMPNISGGVLGDCAENARDVLGDTGEEILEGWYWEETVPLGTPIAKGYADGTVFIMDTELLVNHGDGTTEFWTTEQHADCPPIEEPYAKHWLVNQNPQNTQRPHFGDEAAFDPGTRRLYFRNLYWGVLLTTPEKERKLGTWPLDNLWMSTEGLALQSSIPINGAPDMVITREAFSFDGNVHVTGEYSPPNFKRGTFRRTTTAAKMTATGLTRVRNIRVISTPKGVLPPVPSTIEFGDLPQLTNA